MLAHLFFVRHAHSVYTRDELQRPLSEQGFLDARKITEILKYEKIDYVISSPYRRAIQTVEGVAGLLGKEVIIEDDFKERKLSEKPADDFHAAIAKVWEDDSFSWVGGESNKSAQVRGVQATLQVLEKHKGKNIVIGTHGNIMVLIMNYFNERYGFEFWRELDMPDIYKLSFDHFRLIEVTRLWNREGE
ncbi:histidine phosphatase family protein [Cytobacillus depressus]|uniref:Histidine phosphatase family protein n=1 Tax=Cytobacillus depressus TaxID=1602942 RepID=A0A6L3UZN1_9BACI|nr:histidine phosphatase family protein [Cytobacillus depressus]KAB2329956.1 histidine phosphatase family protein [Cytobacillus depressus]